MPKSQKARRGKQAENSELEKNLAETINSETGWIDCDNCEGETGIKKAGKRSKPFQNEMSKPRAEWMVSDQMKKTAMGNLKKPGRSVAVIEVKQAWDSLPNSLVAKIFQKTSISKQS